MDGKRYLGFWCRISIAEGFKEVGNGQSQVGTGAGLSGVGVSLQHEGLCHVTQGFLNSLCSNLPAFPKVSGTSPGGKSQEELAAECGIRVAQPWIRSTIGAVIAATSASWWP